MEVRHTLKSSTKAVEVKPLFIKLDAKHTRNKTKSISRNKSPFFLRFVTVFSIISLFFLFESQSASATKGNVAGSIESSPLLPKSSISSNNYRDFLYSAPQVPLSNQSQIKLSVQAGISGYARPGNWIPVIVDLDNSGSNVEGEVVINVAPPTSPSNGYSSGYQSQLQTYTTLYVQPVSLPGGAKKQVTMYVPFSGSLFNRNIIVDYNGHFEGENVTRNLASSATLLDVLSNNLLVGIFSSTPERYSVHNDLLLSGLNMSGPNKGASFNNSGNNVTHLTFVTLDPVHLPDISQMLDSLNIIMFQDYDLSKIKQSQWSAIKAWINSGGILLLSGGQGSERALKNLPPELAPVANTKSADLVNVSAATTDGLEKLGGQPLPPLMPGGNMLIARLTPVANALPTLSFTNNEPVAVGLRTGSGAIVMTSLDLGDQRLLDWGGVDKLWAAILKPFLLSNQVFSSYNLYGVSSAYQTNAFYGALTNIPGLVIPSLSIMGGLALLYILLVGPVSYFTLKILKKRELAWVVLPLITLVFGSSIYLFALKDKGTDIITSSVSIVRLPDGSSGRVTRPVMQVLGVFAPKDNSYTVDLQPNTLLRSVDQPQYLPPPPPQQYSQQSTNTPAAAMLPPIGLKISQSDQRSEINLLGMKQWTFRNVMAEGNITLSGNLESDLSDNSGYITGTITNRTGHAMQDVLVVGAYGYQKLGRLQVGETARVNFKVNFGQQFSADEIYSQPDFRNGPLSNPTSEQRTEQRKQMILQTIDDILPYGLNAGGFYGRDNLQSDNNSLAIIGWSDTPLLEYKVNKLKVGGNDLAVFVSTPHLNILHSTEMMPGTVRGVVSDISNLSSTSNPNNQSIPPTFTGVGTPLDSGSMTVDFNLTQFGSGGVLKQSGKQIQRLLFTSQSFVQPSGYGQPKLADYKTEVYNWKTTSWEGIPGHIAPPACLADLPVYTGGKGFSFLEYWQAYPSATTPPTTVCKQSNITYNNSNTGGVKATPTAITVPFKTTSTTGVASTNPSNSSVLAQATASPTAIVNTVGGGYNNGGSNLSFNVLGNGNDFHLTDYISADGKIRLRFSRNSNNQELIIFTNFSVGYTVK